MLKPVKQFLISFCIIHMLLITLLPPSLATAASNVTIDSITYQGSQVTATGTYVGGGLLNSVTMELFNQIGNKVSSPKFTYSGGGWTFTDTLPDGSYRYNIRRTTYVLLTGLLGSTENFPLDFTIDTTKPVISISSPTLQKVKKIVITGTVTDNYTQSDQITMELQNSNSSPISDAVFSAPTATNNQWSYTLPGEFSDGTYKFYVKATDSRGNFTIEPYTVTVDSTRPKVASIKVNLSDSVSTTEQSEIDLLTSEDMNYVKRVTSITVTITDEKMLSTDKINNMIMLLSSTGTKIPGTSTVTRISDTNYQVVFTPSALAPSTTYFVYINPAYIDLSPEEPATTDAAGNPLFPLIKKFTTERESDPTKIQADKALFHSLNDPHGNNANNTNTCSNCHSTHVSTGPILEQPSFNYPTYNYCMACHDGTVAATPENINQNGHFSAYNDLTVKKMATDCSTCHNPHLTWRAENPNLLDDHYVVENHPAVEGVATAMFDSDKLLCESCHESNSGIVKEYVPINEDDPIKVNYKVRHYRKATATGVPDDYALCFRCHDGSKENISDIETFYQDTNSKHRITAIDGGKLVSTTTANDGHIPCGECHGTHGSVNIKMLKNKLGHQDRRTLAVAVTNIDLDSDGVIDNIDTNSNGIWDPDKEKIFCEKCHNGSTAIYGVTGKALTATNHPEPLAACSSCHGGTAKTFMEAVHAPK